MNHNRVTSQLIFAPKGQQHVSLGQSAASPQVMVISDAFSPERAQQIEQSLAIAGFALSGLRTRIGSPPQGGATRLTPFRSALGWHVAAPSGRTAGNCFSNCVDACGHSGKWEPAGQRRGFTLVEMLVVVAVLLILIVMTVTAIDFTFTSERVRSGARQVQSAMEGARDRAIFARESRGLRLMIDPDDPRIVTSMIYVGGTQNWSEGRIQLRRIDDAAPFGTADTVLDTNNDGTPDATSVAIVVGDASCAWNTLKQRGFLGLFEDRNLNGVLDAGEDQNGNGLLDLDAPRIKIPADDNGSWYTVLTHRLNATTPVLELMTPYRDPGTTPPNEVVAFQGGGPSTYILELPPRILPDAQPILLPEGICIDLDGSDIPAAWRPGAVGASITLEQQYMLPYSAHMDIMFSPRGVVTGPLAAQGILHLYLAERKDVLYATNQGVQIPPPPASGTQTRRPPVFSGGIFLVPGQNQFTADDALGQRIAISVFTQTGKISSHQINAVDAFNNATGASGSDGYADAPFLFATQGEATNQ